MRHERDGRGDDAHLRRLCIGFSRARIKVGMGDQLLFNKNQLVVELESRYAHLEVYICAVDKEENDGRAP
jgi:hypothetical protein